ncbi:MAG: 50S ribosomal protein L27 [Deltaproteobacteria bacterium]|nr:50S ribosomal protein L27 [Deltaproteobacteria bacterium]
MAHKKAGGSSSNGRNSPGQRLGVKRFAGQMVNAGEILIRQVGTKYHPGQGVGIGRDHTIYALTNGLVKFTNYSRDQKKVNVLPCENYVG